MTITCFRGDDDNQSIQDLENQELLAAGQLKKSHDFLNNLLSAETGPEIA